jgi:hypothetical protein
MPLAFLKLLLIPLGIAGFVLLLLVLGTIALGVALAVISALSWLGHFAFGSGKHRPRN